jgi:DNA processing protein
MMNTALFHCVIGIALTLKLRLPPKLASVVLLALARASTSKENVADVYRELYPTLPPLTNSDIDNAEKVIERTLRAGIVGIPVSSAEYPACLSQINDSPPVIFYRGSLSTLTHCPGVAVVGTRKATKYGLLIAERISRHFGEKEWVIVSGLALGIDAAAHRGALDGSGRTIAVLAHGLDTVYPKANQRLADEILANQGLLLSEYPAGIPAKPEQFVHRNRIQIGLSAGSVIVEGEEKSGTRAQAEYCLKNQRHLFAVMPSEATASLSLVSALPLQLVSRRGAVPIYTRDDYDKVEMLLNAKKREIAASPRFASSEMQSLPNLLL